MIRSLPRKQVLRGHGAFTRILGMGTALREGSVKLWYAPSRSSDSPKIGFAVTRALGDAVARNRVKRCLREAVRLHHDRFYQNTIPFDIVLMYVGSAVKRAGEIRCKDLERQVLSAFKRFMVRISDS